MTARGASFSLPRRTSVRRNLAHGWQLEPTPLPVANFIRQAVRAVPFAMAKRLGRCRIALASLEADQTSTWSATETALEISVAAETASPHDVALELLTCLGQTLWYRLTAAERALYWRLLEAEIREGISGEIDESALEAKQRILADRARSPERLEQYAQASFAATAAEYVHSMWHDVRVRQGSDHLPARHLRRRLSLLARWFPPNPGYRLFPAAPARRLPSSRVK